MDALALGVGGAVRWQGDAHRVPRFHDERHVWDGGAGGREGPARRVPTSPRCRTCGFPRAGRGDRTLPRAKTCFACTAIKRRWPSAARGSESHASTNSARGPFTTTWAHSAQSTKASMAEETHAPDAPAAPASHHRKIDARSPAALGVSLKLQSRNGASSMMSRDQFLLGATQQRVQPRVEVQRAEAPPSRPMLDREEATRQAPCKTRAQLLETQTRTEFLRPLCMLETVSGLANKASNGSTAAMTILCFGLVCLCSQ